jgi:hypothetical protein
MKKYLFVLSAVVLFAFSSCQKIAGDPVSKDFTVGSYTELAVEDGFDVTVSDAVDVVTVTVGENIMPKVVVQVEGNTLKIHLKGINHSNYGTDMKVIIPYNADLTCVCLSGASDFHSEYGLEGERVDVVMTGASDFYCDIDADEVAIALSGSSDIFGDILADEIEMEVSGSSNIKGYVEVLDLDLGMSGASDATLEGYVGTLKMELTGASNIKKTINGNRYGLVCDRCEGSMSGASDAYIHCDGTIKVDLSGASELHFTGDGNPADSSTSGGSDIIHDVNP